MSGHPADDVGSWWLQIFRNAGRATGCIALACELDDRDRCGCGQRRADHPRTVEDPALCWHLYATARSLNRQQQRNREQAMAAFPFAMRLVVVTAHSDVPRWQSDSAWAVIDAVDAGKPLIPALAVFMHVSPAVVRASRMLSEDELFFRSASFRDVVRFLRSLAEARIQPQEYERLTFDLILWLPLLHVVARASGARLCDLRAWVTRMGPCIISYKLRGCVTRHVLRWIRKNRAETLRCLRSGRLPGILSSLEARGVPRPVAGNGGQEPAEDTDLELAPRLVMTLSGGWHARTLVSVADVQREGTQMRHCLATHADRLRNGSTQFFALQSPCGKERITLTATPPIARGDSETRVQLEIAGMGNDGVSMVAFQAITELMHELGTPELRVGFWR